MTLERLSPLALGVLNLPVSLCSFLHSPPLQLIISKLVLDSLDLLLWLLLSLSRLMFTLFKWCSFYQPLDNEWLLSLCSLPSLLKLVLFWTELDLSLSPTLSDLSDIIITFFTGMYFRFFCVIYGEGWAICGNG